MKKVYVFIIIFMISVSLTGCSGSINTDSVEYIKKEFIGMWVYRDEDQPERNDCMIFDGNEGKEGYINEEGEFIEYERCAFSYTVDYLKNLDLSNVKSRDTLFEKHENDIGVVFYLKYEEGTEFFIYSDIAMNPSNSDDSNLAYLYISNNNIYISTNYSGKEWEIRKYVRQN